MNKYIVRSVLVLFVIFFTGCIEIIQIIDVSKDKVLSSFIRLKVHINNEKRDIDNSKVEDIKFHDYPNLKIKFKNISNQNYSGLDYFYNIPLSNLKQKISLTKKEIFHPPYLDKSGQLIFILSFNDDTTYKKLISDEDKMKSAILGMFSYNLFFTSEWMPKSVHLMKISDGTIHPVDIVSMGSGVFIEIPMYMLIEGSILTVSKTNSIDLKTANNFVKKFIKENEIRIKKEEAERIKAEALDRKKQEEIDREEAKLEAEQGEIQKLNELNDGEEEE